MIRHARGVARDLSDPGGSTEMTEMAALAYGLLATFVMSSVSRNKRHARANPPILNLFALALLGFSAALGAMLLGYVGWQAFVA